MKKPTDRKRLLPVLTEIARPFADTEPTRAPEAPEHHKLGRVSMRQPGDSEGPHRLSRTYASSWEAFPRSCEYACPLTIHRRRLKLDERIGIAVLLIGLLGLAVVLWGNPPPAPAGCMTDTECGCTIDCLEPAEPAR